jgi:hypothetical protein
MPNRRTSKIYSLEMSHGSIASAPMIRLGLHRGPLLRLERHRKAIPKSLVSIIWSTSSIPSFVTCRSRRETMRSSFAHLSYLKSKGTSTMASVRRLLEASTSILIMHHLITPNGRGKELPEPEPPVPCIRLILLMLHPVTFLAWLPERRDSGLHSELTRRHSF